MTTEKFEARPLDVTRPTAARLYDYYLGGTAHYDVDTVFAERMFKICPYLDVSTHHNPAFVPRDREQFTAFFDGLTIVDPGLVYAPDWRPTEPVDTDDPIRPWFFAAVAGKP